MSFGTATCVANGSEFKLTMKAASVDVSITKKLCHLSQELGIPNIISSDLVRRSEFSKQYCRKIGNYIFSKNAKSQIY